MTRFARARGSKASNEKAPEDGTPWEVMKDQLVQTKKYKNEAKKREEAEKQRKENYENFLKDQKVQKRKATWCDFPESVEPVKKQTKHENQNNDLPFKKKKKNKLNSNGEQSVSEVTGELPNTANKDNTGNSTQNKVEKKSKKKNKVIKQTNKGTVESQTHPTEKIDSNNSLPVQQPVKQQKKKKNKNKKVKLTIVPVENSGSHADNESSKSNTNPQISEETKNKSNNFVNKKNKIKASKKKKDKKLVDSQPARRKVINDRSFQLIINGKEVELVRFDGFPIMKKDGERLEELKNNMIKKGIPKSEVQRTLKLERRRAEKALARLRREVCYNCRKGGHNLSDCPDLKSKIPGVDAPEGICFKCGSTEHRQFECKVQRDKEFKFATCFICKESGHIARQCPDNPKGLYPNGGCCKLCGDVTHLKKDCPTIKDKKEETSIKLQMLDNDNNIEDISQQTKTTNSEEKTKKPKKIKF